jgi:hypothetical protein
MMTVEIRVEAYVGHGSQDFEKRASRALGQRGLQNGSCFGRDTGTDTPTLILQSLGGSCIFIAIDWISGHGRLPVFRVSLL